MKKLLVLLLFFASYAQLLAQASTQIVKGKVTDAQSNYPLIGATVIVFGSAPLIGATTNEEGEFKLTNVPLGRQILKVTYMGYREQTIPNVIVTAGKETVLRLQLEEYVVTGKEVVVTANRDRSQTNNELTTVSARSFNVEETSRYAGSRNDPARMAANFAGVSGANDARNDIIIRGNSPAGLLWRLEGINIPNPSHFGALGATGGPVSILNNNTLDKSDFMTAAFPAQYGNAVAGVFDLGLRNGNRDKREYLGQIGFNGFELGAEGPLCKGKRGSYLVNYRYSTLGVFQAIGLDFGTGSATPNYQDLTFKVDLPTTKAGRFTVFGLGGTSSINLLGSEVDTSGKNLYGDENFDNYLQYRTGIFGASHTYYFNSTTYYKATLAASQIWESFHSDSLRADNRQPVPSEEAEYEQNKYSANILVNKKFNNRNNLTVGTIFDLYAFNLLNQRLVQNDPRIFRNSTGESLLSQYYTQWQHKFNDQLTLNSGLTFLHFGYSNSTALEPRVGLKYAPDERQSISVGYGYHSQMQALPSYFTSTKLPNGSLVLTNKELGFTRSQHFVLAYDRTLTPELRIKVETYFQAISKAAVEQRASSFSLLNAGADFVTPDNDSLVNKGTGRNYGVELTLEKFYSQGYYFLFTTSVFDSKYKGSDGILRNTAFNGHYVLNILAGKEFKVGKKDNVLNLDWKVTTAGGRYITPVDFESSQKSGTEVRREHEAYSQQLKQYFRTDFKISFRMNRKRITQEFSLDLQNILNTKNVFIQRYNTRTNQVNTEYQMGFFPIPQYRILF